MAFKPELHTVSNKPYAPAQGGPTDARSYFYDEAAKTYRPYQSIAEVLDYLAIPKHRNGRFPITIEIGGEKKEYWFKDGVADGHLVEKTGSGEAGIGFENVPTYADITDSLAPRFVRVAADENNNGDKSLYLHNGTTLEFLQTIAP